MKTSRLILSLLSISLIYGSLNAQITYMDFTPDETFLVPANSLLNFPFDVDGDNVDDLKLVSANYPGLTVNLGISQIDTANPKFETYYDNSKPQSPIGDFYVKVLNQDDPISVSGNFSNDYPQIGDNYDVNFLSLGPKYLGFRLIMGANNYKYGWMLVEFSGNNDLTFVIKELAYHNTMNASIKAGQKSSVGINNTLKAAGYTMIVDQDNGLLRINNSESKSHIDLTIYSAQGQEVITKSNISVPNQVDMSGMSGGAYITVISDGSSVYSEKFIKMQR